MSLQVQLEALLELLINYIQLSIHLQTSSSTCRRPSPGPATTAGLSGRVGAGGAREAELPQAARSTAWHLRNAANNTSVSNRGRGSFLLENVGALQFDLFIYRYAKYEVLVAHQVTAVTQLVPFPANVTLLSPNSCIPPQERTALLKPQ